MKDNNKGSLPNSRREYLTTLGSLAGAGLLAGCGGNGDGGSDGGDGGDGDMDGGSDGGSDGESDGGSDDDFPSRDIEIVVHYGYGSGGYNEYPRLVGQFMNDRLPDGINTRVTNMEGANGRRGTRYVWNAEPDGHTILMINLQAQTVNQVLLGDEFEPDLREFTWLPQVAQSRTNLAVGSWSDIDSLEDYVERMQSDDPPVHGSTSLSGSQTMGPVMLGELTGLYDGQKVIDNTVIFTTSGDTVVAVGNEDVEVMFNSHSTNVPYLEEGTLKPIMNSLLMSPEESYEVMAHTDGAETVQSTDLIDQETAESFVDIINGRRPFCAPPGTSEDRANYLRDIMSEAIQDDELHQAGEDINRPVDYADSETVARAAENGVEVWSEYSDVLQQVREG